MSFEKSRSEFQERLVNLYLRLNGYFQTGYIPHSSNWGSAGTDIDRIGLRFPNHLQNEREVECHAKLSIPKDSIDIIIAEVKNKSLKFNKSLTTNENASDNWNQILTWIGLFDCDQIKKLLPELIKTTKKDGLKTEDDFTFCSLESKYGTITIRPILFSMETELNKKNSEKKWINGDDIISFMWDCFNPDIKREDCATRYPFELWGSEFSDIVKYFKSKHKSGDKFITLKNLYSVFVEAE